LPACAALSSFSFSRHRPARSLLAGTQGAVQRGQGLGLMSYYLVGEGKKYPLRI
jgi:hypothetical protein